MVSLLSPSVRTVSEPSNSLMVLIKHYCQEPFGVSLRGADVGWERGGQSLKQWVRGP